MDSKIRNQFPFLKRKFRGRSLAYLDNASTTQKPQVVIDAISDVYKNHYANIHRGVYDLSQEATEAYEGVRKKVAKFIGAKDSAEVIFTRNTTESINLLANCLQGPTLPGLQGWSLSDGDEILLTEMEHHSNIVPWQLIAGRLTRINNSQLTIDRKSKIKIKYIPINKGGGLDAGSLDKMVTGKTKILSITLMSNVLGTINDVATIIKKARKICPSLIAIVDAAQAAAHIKLDVDKLGADFVAFSAHKMYGPTGVGVLWGKKTLLDSMPPFMGGGDMILSVGFDETTFNEVPWKFEAGTPSIADVIAFGKAIEFVEGIGFSRIQKHESDLTDYALSELSKIPEVKIYGASFENKVSTLRDKPQGRTLFSMLNRGPVIAFNVDGIHPHDVASILNEEAVAIRSGHHCAQPLMSVLGEVAVCRASFGIYNTIEEVDRLVEGIERVKKVFNLNSKQNVLLRKSENLNSKETQNKKVQNSKAIRI